jgi:hypothetical protein
MKERKGLSKGLTKTSNKFFICSLAENQESSAEINIIPVTPEIQADINSKQVETKTPASEKLPVISKYFKNVYRHSTRYAPASEDKSMFLMAGIIFFKWKDEPVCHFKNKQSYVASNPFQVEFYQMTIKAEKKQ